MKARQTNRLKNEKKFVNNLWFNVNEVECLLYVSMCGNENFGILCVIL